jgi:dual specificity protein kinase YAK1
MLGKGTFGQVVKCLDLETGEHVAVKIVKNLPAYHNQGLVEVRILELVRCRRVIVAVVLVLVIHRPCHHPLVHSLILSYIRTTDLLTWFACLQLNGNFDPDAYPMVRLYDRFVFRNHLCLVFELLNVSLFELIRQNQFKGLSLKLISLFAKQILQCMCALYEARIMHCDLKPENILLEDASGPNLKVIDFGSAAMETQAVYSYIQSRFYRSPEVILGLPYRLPIDTWSLGCICFELFVGLPLFPGVNQHRMLMRFIKFLGMPPPSMLSHGKDTAKFFVKVGSSGATSDYQLKTDEQYAQYVYEQQVTKAHQQGTSPPPGPPAIPLFRDYFKAGTIHDIIMGYEYKGHLSKQERDEETASRRALLHFLEQTLHWDPDRRWIPHELLHHPFITGETFMGEFARPVVPPPPRLNLFAQKPASSSASASSSSASSTASSASSSTATPSSTNNHHNQHHASPSSASSSTTTSPSSVRRSNKSPQGAGHGGNAGGAASRLHLQTQQNLRTSGASGNNSSNSNRHQQHHTHTPDQDVMMVDVQGGTGTPNSNGGGGGLGSASGQPMVVDSDTNMDTQSASNGGGSASKRRPRSKTTSTTAPATPQGQSTSGSKSSNTPPYQLQRQYQQQQQQGQPTNNSASYGGSAQWQPAVPQQQQHLHQHLPQQHTGNFVSSSNAPGSPIGVNTVGRRRANSDRKPMLPVQSQQQQQQYYYHQQQQQQQPGPRSFTNIPMGTSPANPQQFTASSFGGMVNSSSASNIRKYPAGTPLQRGNGNGGFGSAMFSQFSPPDNGNSYLTSPMLTALDSPRGEARNRNNNNNAAGRGGNITNMPVMGTSWQQQQQQQPQQQGTQRGGYQQGFFQQQPQQQPQNQNQHQHRHVISPRDPQEPEMDMMKMMIMQDDDDDRMDEASTDIFDPSDWDPLYSDDQLLDEESLPPLPLPTGTSASVMMANNNNNRFPASGKVPHLTFTTSRGGGGRGSNSNTGTPNNKPTLMGSYSNQAAAGSFGVGYSPYDQSGGYFQSFNNPNGGQGRGMQPVLGSSYSSNVSSSFTGTGGGGGMGQPSSWADPSFLGTTPSGSSYTPGGGGGTGGVGFQPSSSFNNNNTMGPALGSSYSGGGVGTPVGSFGGRGGGNYFPTFGSTPQQQSSFMQQQQQQQQQQQPQHGSRSMHQASSSSHLPAVPEGE